MLPYSRIRAYTPSTSSPEIYPSRLLKKLQKSTSAPSKKLQKLSQLEFKMLQIDNIMLNMVQFMRFISPH